MATIQRFEDFEAWKRARELTRVIYSHTNQALFSKDFALRNQIRSAAVSIMSNIAEGYERDGNKEFIQFLSIAKASAGEVRSQLYVALDTGYINEEDFRNTYSMCREVSVLINGLIRYLRNCDLTGRKYAPD